MADPGEVAFARTFLKTISSQPVTFGDDYQQRPAEWARRVPVLSIPLPAPPARKAPQEGQGGASSSALISITFKSLKPAASYTLSVHPTDTIASIKAQLTASNDTAPPADAFRLLLRGKALADVKLLKEYTVKDGDSGVLVLKPGIEWDPTKPRAQKTDEDRAMDVDGTPKERAQPPTSLGPATTRRGHQRLPSVVLSPSPSSETPGVVEKDILLTLDSGAMPEPVQPEVLSTFSTRISKPEFWEKLYAFLKTEFTVEGDALTAFENFFRASKGAMTASQIAKIRDQVGIVGMAGT